MQPLISNYGICDYLAYVQLTSALSNYKNIDFYPIRESQS